ncbi:MAG: hypothetical protein KAS36_16105, partial [Anaerolineales bacterium]|nr:hypothetical protein [Anaerolineales bacterium]
MNNTRFILPAILILFAVLLGACTGNVAPTPEIAADFTLPEGNGNMVNLADELQENEQVVLVFYYTYIC